MKPTENQSKARSSLYITGHAPAGLGGKAIGLSPKSIPAIRKGDRAMPLDAVFKIAITLQLDPATVIADLEEQREKNETRRGFWRSFLSRAALMVAVIGCTLAWMPSATYESAAALFGGKNRRLKSA